MNIWIVLIFIFFVFALVILIKEWELLSPKKINSLKEETFAALFFPITSKEREQLTIELVEEMEALQKKVSKSLLAKYFIDHQKYIDEHKEGRKWMKSQSTEISPESLDLISFYTRSMHHILAEETFDKEVLLDVGILVEKHFALYQGSLTFGLRKVEKIEIDIQLDLNNCSKDDMVHFNKEKMDSFLHEFCHDFFPNEAANVNIYKSLDELISTFTCDQACKNHCNT